MLDCADISFSISDHCAPAGINHILRYGVDHSHRFTFEIRAAEFIAGVLRSRIEDSIDLQTGMESLSADRERAF